MVDFQGMLNPILRLILLLLLLPAVGCGVARAEGRTGKTWNIELLDGERYVKVSDVVAFYRFKAVKGRAGFLNYGAGNRVLSLRSGKQDIYINNYHFVLSFPIREHAGLLYISTTDVKKLIDPVLRPQFSAENANITTVVLDAGHGGHDKGAVSSYATEKDCNLAVALKVRERLLKRGYKVVMTRDGDYFLTLQQRVAIANQHPNSVFVSIHHNSGGSHATGIETFTLAPHGTTSPFARTRRTEDLQGNRQDSENIALATAVHSRAIKATGAIDRGIQRARFSVLCTIRRPAILFEGGFVSNPTEGARISTDAYRNTLADCITQGICAYANLARGKRTVRRYTGSAPLSTGSGGRIINTRKK